MKLSSRRICCSALALFIAGAAVAQDQPAAVDVPLLIETAIEVNPPTAELTLPAGNEVRVRL